MIPNMYAKSTLEFPYAAPIPEADVKLLIVGGSFGGCNSHFGVSCSVSSGGATRYEKLRWEGTTREYTASAGDFFGAVQAGTAVDFFVGIGVLDTEFQEGALTYLDVNDMAWIHAEPLELYYTRPLDTDDEDFFGGPAPVSSEDFFTGGNI